MEESKTRMEEFFDGFCKETNLSRLEASRQLESYGALDARFGDGYESGVEIGRDFNKDYPGIV